MSTPPLVSFVDVSKIYAGPWPWRRRIQALNRVNLEIQAGEVFGLLGPNRAGKTTLVKLLLSLAAPTSGRVLRLGKPATDRSTLARVGYLHENQAFPRYWDATGLLHYYGALTMMAEPEVRQRVPALLKQVNLADRSREPISQFSKGMIQRLALAQALLNDPDLLVLDEPTEGLDLQGRRLLREVVAERRSQGKSVLLVSHAVPEVEQLCDRVGILVGGRLKHVGSLAALVQEGDNGTARTLEHALEEVYGKRLS